MKVKFLPIDKEFEINPNESVLELAKRTGVFIKSICGGLPSCSECRIKVVSGEHNIMPPNFKEKALIGSAYFVDHSRLSCQVKCMGDIVVDVTEQIAKEHAQPASKKPRMPLRYQRRDAANQKPLITEEPSAAARDSKTAGTAGGTSGGGSSSGSSSGSTASGGRNSSGTDGEGQGGNQ